MPSLQTIQIIALLQGIFLLFVLFKHKKNYQSVNFWLLFSCIISVLLFTLGDDDYNLLIPNADWFFFHDTLIITTFFLYVRFYTADKKVFKWFDLLFIIPYILEISLKLIENYNDITRGIFLWMDYAVELTFFAMLVYTIVSIIIGKKENWLLLFIIPLTIIFSIDELTWFYTKQYDSPFFLDSYGIILLAVFLFYFVLYKLIISPKNLMQKSSNVPYKKSTLLPEVIANKKKELNALMTNDKLFKNAKLTALDVSDRLNISRQQLSELLNVHMHISFQDYVNKHRVQEFKNCLTLLSYTNFTIIAIANEVGFSSKSSFNTIFKKHTGLTPSAYKKQAQA